MMRLQPKDSSDKCLLRSFIKELLSFSLKMDYKQGALLCFLLQVFLCQPVLLQWSFSVPGEITALEGSCLVIPCTFTGPFPRSERPQAFTWCLWSYSGYPEVYNKDPTDVLPQYKGRALLVGDLFDHNCTLQINSVTKEDADTYYPLIGRNYDGSVSVTVSDTPARPKVTYPRTMTEGLPVSITCSVEHTCPAQPPTLAWDKIKTNVSVYHEALWAGIWRTVLLLNYTPAAEHHMEDIVCSATYPTSKSASKTITLFIRHAPKGVDVVLFEDPEEGKTMELSCATKSSNPRETNFTWYKNEKMIQKGKTLKIEKITMDDAGVYHCMAHNAIGTMSSTPVSVNVKASSGSLIVPLVIGVVFAVLAAAAIGAILLTRRYLKNKKKNNNVSTQLKQLPRHDGGQNLFENMDNTYAALDGAQAASEYEEILQENTCEETSPDE
ncbi:myelin-associated glycoprotein isoform X2 [Pleurodeles waltl]